MYKRLTVILFYIAGFVLVLHNVTPHVHTHDSDLTENSLPQSLLDWLGFAFQIDPGAGHLEWFSQDKQSDDHSDLESQISLAYTFHVSATVEDDLEPCAPILYIDADHVIISGAPPGLRGPPQC